MLVVIEHLSILQMFGEASLIRMNFAIADEQVGSLPFDQQLFKKNARYNDLDHAKDLQQRNKVAVHIRS